jgi:hypothetical protein
VRRPDPAVADLYEGIRHWLYRRGTLRLADTDDTALIYGMNDGSEFPPNQG